MRLSEKLAVKDERELLKRYTVGMRSDP